VVIAGRRTKRRFAHELFPHREEGEVRDLAVEVPYLYAFAVGMDVQGTSWSDLLGADLPAARQAFDRTSRMVAAHHLALLADALHQGLVGQAAWAWAAQWMTGESAEVVWERAAHYRVPLDQIKPYPCGPAPAEHEHLAEPDRRGWRTVIYVPGAEEDCEECTEPDPAVPPQAEQLDLGGVS
jgi:hypothetical protein